MPPLLFTIVLLIRPVAQLAERRSPKPQVGGSIPSWPAILLRLIKLFLALGILWQILSNLQ